MAESVPSLLTFAHHAVQHTPHLLLKFVQPSQLGCWDLGVQFEQSKRAVGFRLGCRDLGPDCGGGQIHGRLFFVQRDEHLLDAVLQIRAGQIRTAALGGGLEGVAELIDMCNAGHQGGHLLAESCLLGIAGYLVLISHRDEVCFQQLAASSFGSRSVSRSFKDDSN